MLKLYTMQNCYPCEEVKKFLNEKKIKYIEYDDVQEMLDLGIIFTPMLEVDGKLYQGDEIYSYINNRGDLFDK